MNIFFIFPSVQNDKTVNHGIASLCGVIRKKGHSVDLYHPDKVNIEDLYETFRQKDYSLCLVSTVTNQWSSAIEFIRALKKISDIMVIAGGHHPTSCPEILEENPELDGICIGEGDAALGELLERLEKKEDHYHINNMWFRRRDNNEIVKNEIGNLIENLDDLPMPDYSVFTKRNVLNYPALMFSRGCPYNCSYCCNNSLRKLYRGKGKYIRLKSVGRAMEEVRNFINTYNPPVMHFDDDTFIKNRKWLFSFLDEYREFTKVRFNCNTRPETIDDELCRKLKEANCNIISIGIESGNEHLRKQILKRHMSNRSIKESFDIMKRHGIRTSSFNMVGLPDETFEDHMDTVQLNRDIQPDQMQISIFYPYLGTELGDYAREKGYIPEEGVFSHSYFSESVLNMAQFPKWKIKCAYTFFHFNVLRQKSVTKAVYYLMRYNLLKNIYIKKFLKALLKR